MNTKLRAYCESVEYLYFVDAEKMTFDGNEYRDYLFVSDKIHLNHDGQFMWCNNYIKPQIASIIEERSLEELKK